MGLCGSSRRKHSQRIQPGGHENLARYCDAKATRDKPGANG
jgi:hypothetical protein